MNDSTVLPFKKNTTQSAPKTPPPTSPESTEDIVVRKRPKSTISQANYRVISTSYHTSLLTQEMTIPQSHVEIYLLTCRFANAAGCFPMLTKIMASEARMEVCEFQYVLTQLQKLEVILLLDDYVLLKNWFFHHNVSSTLDGNVAKAVKTDLSHMTRRLQLAWRSSAVEMGVPDQLANNFVMPEEPEAPSEGLLNNNQNNLNLNSNINSTPTKPFVVGHDTLLLTQEGEKYRSMIESEANGVSLQRAQDVADEFCQRIRTGKTNDKAQILDPEAWIKKMIRAPNFELRVGKTVAEERCKALELQMLAEKSALERESKKHIRALTQEKVEAYLSTLDEPARAKIADEVIAHLTPAFRYKADEIRALILEAKTGLAYAQSVIVEYVSQKIEGE